MSKNFINLLSGIGKIGHETISQINDHIFHKIEQYFIQGNYVTREELEVTKAQILKLQEEILQLKKNLPTKEKI